MLTVPPRRRAASRVASKGVRRTSIRRLRERWVQRGERAESVSFNCCTMVRTVSAADEPASGIAVGSASSPFTCFNNPSGIRMLPERSSRSRSGPGACAARASSAAAIRSGSRGGSSGGWRSRSRNWSERATPASPSTIAWCSFSIRALFAPLSPSTTTNCHRGRVRSKGSQAMWEARSRSWRILPGLGRARWRMW